MNWIWLLLALLAVVVLVWWLWPTADLEEPVVVTEEELEPLPTEPVVPAAEIEVVEPILVVEIVADPAAWAGRTVQGEARVASVPTDRGFWIGQEGSQLFVVLDEQGDEVPVDVNPEMTLRIRAAEVHAAEDIAEVSGNLDAETREIIQDQEIFLTVDDADLDMSPGAGTSPDEDPAEGTSP